MSLKCSAKNIRITIVISEFNLVIIERLLIGAKKAFSYHGGLKNNLKIFRVPGAFEIPGTIQFLLKHGNPDAVVAIGAIIKGETPHFEIIANESAHGISKISLNMDMPIINGILTTDDIAQAMKRSNPIGRNKGWDAMEAALQTLSIYKEIKTTS